MDELTVDYMTLDKLICYSFYLLTFILLKRFNENKTLYLNKKRKNSDKSFAMGGLNDLPFCRLFSKADDHLAEVGRGLSLGQELCFHVSEHSEKNSPKCY